VGGIDLDWDPAPRPDDRYMNEHEHMLVVDVEEALGLEVNRGTVPGPVSRNSRISAAPRSIRRSGYAEVKSNCTSGASLPEAAPVMPSGTV
jgi:hypothetical protein